MVVLLIAGRAAVASSTSLAVCVGILAPVLVLADLFFGSRIRRRMAFRTVAVQTGLEVQPGGELRGRINGYLVIVDRIGVRIRIEVEGGFSHSITLEGRRAAGRALSRIVTRSGVATGDATFDENVELSADDEVVLRVWAAHRRLLIDNADSIDIRAGSVRWEWLELGTPAPRLVSRIQDAVSLVETLRATDDIPTSFRKLIERSASRDQRRLALRLLVRRHKDSPETDRACASAMSSEDPLLRTIAAGHRKDFAALRELNSSIHPDDVRAEAISLLPHDEACAAIDQLLRGTSASVGFDAAVRIGYRPPSGLVASALRPNASYTLDAVGILEVAGSDVASSLTELVRRETRGPVLRRVFPILARIGDASAVDALREHAESGIPGRLPGEARDAMRAIQARLSGTSGQLTIISGAAKEGALSDAERSGAVSLAGKTTA